MLTGLCKLKELSMIMTGGPLQPLVISSVAKLTKLLVSGDVVSHTSAAYQPNHSYPPMTVDLKRFQCR